MGVLIYCGEYAVNSESSGEYAVNSALNAALPHVIFAVIRIRDSSQVIVARFRPPYFLRGISQNILRAAEMRLSRLPLTAIWLNFGRNPTSRSRFAVL